MKKRRLLLTLAVSSLVFGSLGAITSCDETKIPSVDPEEYQGEGEPSNDFGKDGDTYLDTLTGKTYVKVNGSWEVKSNTKHYDGSGRPNPQFGNEGDTYTDTTTGDEYIKRNGSWDLTKEGNLVEKHTVTFDLNGGKIGTASFLDPVKVKHGEWVDEPLGTPVKKNATFIGWYDGDFKWNFHSPVNGDLTLVAMYNADEGAKVSFTVDPNNGEAPYTWEGTNGDYPKLAIPSKGDDYEFVGWIIEETGESFIGIANEEVNGMTLVAKYVKASFNFKFTYKAETKTIAITGLNNIDTVSVVIPDKLDGIVIDEIADNAFGSKIKLEYVTFGANIKVCSPKAFTGCRALKGITVTGGNLKYKSVDGILYSADETELVFVPQKACADADFTIPKTVTKVGPYAFYGQSDEGVKSINFPSNLVEIGERAFYDCKNVTSWNFPNSLKKIGDYAFCKFDSVNQEVINFNDGLEYIGDGAFVGAYIKNTLTLPSTVKHIGARAFANCTAITKFVFPRDLTTLGENPLSNCTGILEIELESGNTTFAMDDGVLYTKDYKTLVLCPSGRTEAVTVKTGCELIGPFAFYEVDNLSSITIPSTVTEFGESAFEDCYHITEFVIPNSVTKIGEACFDDCEDLRSITIGNGIQEIPRYAFWGCNSLSEITIPANVKKIGDFAFAYSVNISKITFEEGVEEIGACAFMYGWLDEYLADPGSKIKNLVLPNSLKVLSDTAFNGHTGITTITIGSGLEVFDSYQFSSCNIRNIIIKNSNYLQNSNGFILSKDGKTLYYVCQSAYMGDVEIPAGVETIYDFAFYRSSTVKSALEADGFVIDSVIMPSSLVTVKEGAFTNIKVGTVSFGSNLRTIENHAFYSADFNGITFANGLETIDEDAFTLATGIKNIVFPNSLKTIGNGAFTLSDVRSVKFNEGLVTIGDDAFDRAKVSGVVKLPTTLKNLGANAFFSGLLSTNYVEEFDLTGNPYLISENGMVMDTAKTKVIAYASGYKVDGTNYQTSITLPSTITTVGAYALSYAPYLTNITLPAGLTRIEDCAFESTGNLSHLIIPASVEYVGYRAFNGWKVNTRLSFECSAIYAGMHFHKEYLNGVSTTNTVVTYNYVG